MSTRRAHRALVAAGYQVRHGGRHSVFLRPGRPPVVIGRHVGDLPPRQRREVARALAAQEPVRSTP